VLNTSEAQAIAKIRVYPGADGAFTLYQDDGKTYAYEKGDAKLTTLRWDDAAGKLSHEGASAWSQPDEAIVEVLGHK
jgi:alpha-D-xyloside xylohydrolase